MKVELVRVDYLNEQHGSELLQLMNDFAKDPVAGGKPLPVHVQENLVAELAKRSSAFSFICYVDSEAAGLVNCFELFSTFKCMPLVNIHDLIVAKKYRGMGLSQLLLSSVEDRAKEIGCCKITLEALEGNKVAYMAYQKFGFVGYELNPEMGKAMFLEKII